MAIHLAGLVAQGMDAQALSDDNGFFDTTSGPLSIPNDPGSATTYTEWAAILAMTVDGRRSSTPAEGGILMHPDAFNDADVLYRNANSPESFAERLARVTRLRVNASMPAAVSNVVTMLVFRGRTPAAVQADVARIANRGHLHRERDRLNYIHRCALAAFSVQDVDAYDAVKVNNS